MQESIPYLIATATGAIVGIVQWSVFAMWNPSQKKQFSTHLRDLRGHLLVGEAVMFITTALLALVLNRLDSLKWLALAFALSGMGVVAIRTGSYLKNHDATCG
jgi:hypothetical protein